MPRPTLAAASSSSSSSRSRHPAKRRKARSLLRRLARFSARNTWAIPLALLACFGAAYAVHPAESNPVHHFIFLSYRQPNPLADLDPTLPAHYGKGLWDIAFVAFYTIVLTFSRELMMQELLIPLGRRNGIKSRGKLQRFAEQMYTAIYFSLMGPAGVYVMSRSPVWYFNTAGMYEAFPHRTHEACFKFYYLFQAAYWAQQGIVMLLGFEKPRKDYKELVAHHVVTLALIGLSYRFHFTHMGIAVYITHDISDVFLALSKSLHYIDSPLVVPVYVCNIFVWCYLRHYINLRILYSVLTEFRTVGPYELDWETQQYKCWISNAITFALLASLQALNLFWLYCLLRSMYKFLVYRIKKDDRSESSGEEEGQPLVPEGVEGGLEKPAADGSS
ncbi:longevity assurance proteins LAG1/LAC1 [Trichoderma citrinoviride]|uniref:Longevity assurance proteins LAG1/LAC1 n=1 Tax=Trichoderma citrinoviride TaxID=58853 RepID=A0A2T4BA00_9HYPO|nr:longevity assurance proteins LAG1/LAC1 [Trichoderma citrinoviride]PTB66147.1 longevity assurance proteins LAG1/LAC1 [Trichoderma citrinoviride]